MAITIRPYQPQDREQIRSIALATADAGEGVPLKPAAQHFLSDILTRYYTDYEPLSTWVADDMGSVVGYLTGSLDTSNYLRVMREKIVPSSSLLALINGAVFDRHWWRLLGAGILTGIKAGNYREKYLTSHPAHLHMNIQSTHR